MQTSWQKDSRWYSELTAGSGHYYHEHIVLGGVLKLLNLNSKSKILDLACGAGVLARRLAPAISYTGIDLSPNLIESAKRSDKNTHHQYLVADVSKPLSVAQDFTHATLILSLQNIKTPACVITNAGKHLIKNGTLVIVLNHPCFRIPRQSSWGIDEANKLQYRRINRYLSPLEIPIQMHPGQRHSSVTWSFHQPLSVYSQMLASAGFVIQLIEEWTSDKSSEGGAAKMENRSRSEFPLFLTIKAIKS
ncbi:MAG: class I SAM-dependent methyltransferase [Candidatus Beckwithbacteria bacterium]|nr:class I SAM-dependent methyltransferase [Candidatus Beckwithbacteria bacterium]